MPNTPNKGILRLGLIDVEGRPARDERVDVVLFGGHSPRRTIKKYSKRSFPPRWHKLVVPAYPEEFVLSCDIVPSRFRTRGSGPFSLVDGETVERDWTVFRKPDSWSSRFVSWKRLPKAFASLKRVLRDSRDVALKTGGDIGRFAEGIYDQASDPDLRLAKACLLNLFSKLTRMTAPGGNRHWFSFVQEILIIDQERFVAIVDEEMAKIVRAIRSDIDSYDDYKKTGAKNHHGNLPSRYDVKKKDMYSIKSEEKKGNIQLTIGPGTDPSTGKAVYLLDADIDESGELFDHVFDLFMHKFSGGTHPFDIREFLLLEKPGLNTGYTLV